MPQWESAFGKRGHTLGIKDCKTKIEKRPFEKKARWWKRRVSGTLPPEGGQFNSATCDAGPYQSAVSHCVEAQSFLTRVLLT